MSEKTVEYAVVPVLQRFLAESFGAAIPIFFWRTREGNRTSAAIHNGRRFRALAMFARRPKLEPECQKIQGKINHELLQFAADARAVGVPTIAALPVAYSLFDLYGPDLPIAWIPLTMEDQYDINFMVEVVSTKIRAFSEDAEELSVLDLKAIPSLITSESEVFEWEEFVNLTAELRGQTTLRTGAFPWLGGYKPVYLLIP